MSKRNSNTGLSALVLAAVVIGAAYIAKQHSSSENATSMEQTEAAVNSEQSEGSSASSSNNSTASTTDYDYKSFAESPAKVNVDRSLIEIPETKKGELVVAHVGYQLSFNKKTNCPNWVAWELTKEEAQARMDRCDEFYADPEVPSANRVTTQDYVGSGYDRGHMCPSADMKWSGQAQNQCFYLSNICPQLHALNAGPWEKLESACRRWAKQEGSVYIVSGPVFDGNRKAKTIGDEHSIMVPKGFFKVVLSTRSGKEKAIGFYYANNDSDQNMQNAAMSVDDVEKMTGYNFFPNLDDKVENRVEASYKLSDWK